MRARWSGSGVGAARRPYWYRSVAFAAIIVAIFGLWAASAEATKTVTLTGTSPIDSSPLKATAIFEIGDVAAGDQKKLTITLINEAPDNSNNKDVPGNVLTALFFSLTSDPTLSPVPSPDGAVIPAGSMIVQADKCDVDGSNPCTSLTVPINVGGEWDYAQKSQLAADKQVLFPAGMNQGIASSGFDIFGSGTFNGPNLDDPNSVDGMNFGIISASDQFNPNGGAADEPFIKDRVVFMLTSGVALYENNIGIVRFQYGTSLSEPKLQVPEPGSFLIFGSTLASLASAAWVARRRRRRS